MQNYERYTNVMRTIAEARQTLVTLLADESRQNKILKEFAPKNEKDNLTADGKIIYSQVRDLQNVIDNKITQ